ncbi:DUF3037 domain-containing protein [Phytoactinopolyspora alkaliphila]|uniref:DUF3037 domain-containing protein n=1 Tax=Phytoactinopolyspora alkaliphila TaxID=1783498 RepID=A0A6N9YLB1_9ACTN|nr:DUF3037 domain-containing protein [Phytoactinopolyspora alkaliphila]NED95638.1 DUF3037 domain-containing protein [Phytoactinopolyspora alkaliphila]
MSERYPFDYVTVRIVPRIQRGEFINVGVIVYCQAMDYLDAAVEVDQDRLRALDPGADADELTAAAKAYVTPCSATAEDPAAPLSPGERFRWLAAPRSTVVQPGVVHPGLTADPAGELAYLLDTLVR